MLHTDIYFCVIMYMECFD